MGKEEQKSYQNRPAIEFQKKSPSVLRLILLGVSLGATVILASILGRQYFGEPILLAILGAFACMGVFFLFALVLGLLTLTSTKRSEEFSRRLVAGMPSGIVVSDDQGRILHSNDAYAELIGAKDVAEVASVESTFFPGIPK